MRNKPLPAQEYEEINLIYYIRIIKKHAASIARVIAVFIIIAIVVGIVMGGPVTYKGKMMILSGSIQEKPIETLQEINDFLIVKYEDTLATATKSNLVISTVSRASSPQEVISKLQEIFDSLANHQAAILTRKTQQIDRQIKILEGLVEKTGERLARYQAKIDSISIYQEGQAIGIEGYLQSYDNALSRLESLELRLNDLEVQKLYYKEPEIKKAPSVSPLFFPRALLIILNVFIGFAVGIIVGVLWAFTKEWWETNKPLLR